MRPVLAIATNLLRELLRQRASALFLLLVAGSAVALPRIAGGGESLRNQLQLAANYGIGFPAFLIGLAVLSVAAGAISRDVESQRIQTVVTKACARWQILLGKLLGILTLAAALLAVVLLIFVVNTATVGAGQGAAVLDEELAHQRFYTPRVAIHPELPGIDEEALRRYLDELRSDPDGAPGLTGPEFEKRARMALRSARVPPGGAVEFRFPELPPPPSGQSAGRKGVLFVSFAVHWSPPGGEPRAPCRWEVRTEVDGTSGSPLGPAVEEQVSMAIPHEFSFPVESTATDSVRSRSVVLTLRNPAGEESGRTLIVDPLDVEILVPYGSFWASVARAAALLLAQFTLLATLGLIGSSLFSTATAYLLGFFLYATSLSSGFLLESFEIQSVLHPRSFMDWVGSILATLGEKALALFPDLSSLDPVGRLSMGRALTWAELSGEVAWILGVQGALVFLSSAWLLSRREMAGGER